MALQEAHDLPMRERIEAEVRFAKWSQRALGGEDAVAEVHKAWPDVSEFEANQIDASTATKAATAERPMPGRVQQVGRHRRGALWDQAIRLAGTRTDANDNRAPSPALDVIRLRHLRNPIFPTESGRHAERPVRRS